MQNTVPELMQSPLHSLPKKCGPTVMRKLLQSRATKKFLTVAGGWTRDIHRAADFIDTHQIRAAIVTFKLTRVQLYYLFHNDSECDYNFAVPL